MSMTTKEVDNRLQNIRDYNAYQRRIGQPHHCTTRRELEAALISWGHDPARAAEATKEPAPSPILAKIGSNAEQTGGGFS